MKIHIEEITFTEDDLAILLVENGWSKDGKAICFEDERGKTILVPTFKLDTTLAAIPIHKEDEIAAIEINSMAYYGHLMDMLSGVENDKMEDLYAYICLNTNATTELGLVCYVGSPLRVKSGILVCKNQKFAEYSANLKKRYKKGIY